MAATKIQWCDVTWSPVTGCSPVSAGCEHCFARRMANRLRGRYGYPADEPFRVTFHADRLAEPLGWHKPRRVFVCSMADVFHEKVDDTEILSIFRVMERCQHHRFILLTKRPERMAGWGEWAKDKMTLPLPHVALGVSVENQIAADRRIHALERCPAALRFVSYEPALGDVDFAMDCNGLDWLIVGCETGPRRRPCPLARIRAAVQQCRAASIPVFVKQIDLGDRVSSEPAEWPEDLRIREFPHGWESLT